MNISGDRPLHLRPVEGERPSATPGPAPASTGRSRLELSPQGRELSEASRRIQEAPDVRAERVEALRTRIESGDYQVDLDRLAEHLAKIL